ncbi:class F sortase [Streptomyces beijiangensis]|nr:class F sortase [Streptomyces beijiangensis]
MPHATPIQVHIPSIHVDAPLTGLSLDAEHHLAPPPEADANLAGWFRDGTPPGTDGTAIIAGHVDNDHGPAVFYNLGALKNGNRIEVDRSDGQTAVFTIDTVEAFDADDFPSQKIYGPSPHAELRVITCGAGFDTKAHRYRGNVVAFAHLTATRATH